MNYLLDFLKNEGVIIYCFYVCICFIHDFVESISINKYKYIKANNCVELSNLLVKCSYPVTEIIQNSAEKILPGSKCYHYCQYLINAKQNKDGSYPLDNCNIYKGEKSIFNNDEITNYDYPVILIKIMKHNRVHFNFKHFILSFSEHCIFIMKSYK